MLSPDNESIIDVNELVDYHSTQMMSTSSEEVNDEVKMFQCSANFQHPPFSFVISKENRIPTPESNINNNKKKRNYVKYLITIGESS